MGKKEEKKKDLSEVTVSKERKGSIRGREFNVYGKEGVLEQSVEVDHFKESPPGKSEAYLTKSTTLGGKKGIVKTPLRMHRTKAEVAKRFPSISAKLPKLR